jgi:phosphate transport system permease protein
MTDGVEMPARLTESVHTTDAAARRVMARARANGRMKLYGLLAIGFAVGALVLLLASVFERAAKSVTEHYAVMEIAIPEDAIDPENIAATDFAGILKKHLKETYQPSGRRERRQVYALLSDGAADDLRAAVQAGTLKLGAPVRRPMLLSDDVDLYLRGDFGALTTLSNAGALDMSEDGKEIALTANDAAFREVVGSAKAQLRDQADALRAQAARQERGISVLTEKAAGLSGAEADGNTAQIAAFTAKRDTFLARADALDQKILAQADATLALTDEMPSYFVRVNDGILKLTAVSADTATAKPLIAPSALGTAETWALEVMETPEAGRSRMTDLQVAIVEDMRSAGDLEEEWNARFFSKGDSREPELAGIKGAIVGSLLTMLITFVIAFPTGVLAAIYLEEFAPKNKLTDFIEVNINNLAAVPSIVFGLLGVGVFLWLMPDLRSTPLIGGFVLALMTLPTIVIASRAALKAVPPSIRSAALGLGASRTQTVFHHVLPLAMPGILTGSIIGMAQALGETAPLLLIGMVAFITSVPTGVTDAATVLPVQVFIWANQSETMFDYRTAAAIVVLLGFLIVMNLLAIVLRKRFERRW